MPTPDTSLLVTLEAQLLDTIQNDRPRRFEQALAQFMKQKPVDEHTAESAARLTHFNFLLSHVLE